MVAGWLYSLLAARRHAGGLAMDAPVLASVWNRLADGYQAFEACRCGNSAPPFCRAAAIVRHCSLPVQYETSQPRLWPNRRNCSRPASGDLFSLTEGLKGWKGAP